VRILSRLPLNRWYPGVLMVEDDGGSIILGPFSCRGKADNGDAVAHGNPQRYPTLPYGDHPYGGYHVALVQKDKPTAHTYGPYFLLLDPVSGDALKGKQNGRTGIALHGGDLSDQDIPYGPLRATDGCLRTTNEAISAIAALAPTGWVYVCEPIEG
jgi:hypothetical protein